MFTVKNKIKIFTIFFRVSLSIFFFISKIMSFFVDQNDFNYRKLITTKNIPPNELILESESLVSAVFSANLNTNCSSCFKFQNSLSFCGGCLSKSYCNKECQAKDWKNGHKYECAILKKIKASSSSINTLFLLLLRVIIMKDIVKDSIIIEKIKLLISNKELFPAHKITFFREMSIIILKHMEIPMEMGKIEEIIEIICKLSLNSFTIHSHLDEPIGLGIFVPNNYINHSCDPNSRIIFIGRFQRVFSLKEIQKGEEITISYCQKFDSQENIQKFLLENYLFKCKCTRCQAKENSLPLRVFEILNALGEKQTALGEKLKLFEEIMSYQKINEEIKAKAFGEISLAQINCGKYEEAYNTLKKYAKCFEKQTEEVKKINIELAWKYAELSKLAKLYGKLKKCLYFGERALNIFRKVYYGRMEEIFEIKELENSLAEVQNIIKMNEIKKPSLNY